MNAYYGMSAQRFAGQKTKQKQKKLNYCLIFRQNRHVQKRTTKQTNKITNITTLFQALLFFSWCFASTETSKGAKKLNKTLKPYGLSRLGVFQHPDHRSLYSIQLPSVTNIRETQQRYRLRIYPQRWFDQERRKEQKKKQHRLAPFIFPRELAKWLIDLEEQLTT